MTITNFQSFLSASFDPKQVLPLAVVATLLATPSMGWAADHQATSSSPAPEGKVSKVENDVERRTEEQNVLVGKLSTSTTNELRKLHEAMMFQNRVVANELADDEQTALGDMAMLWQAAVERSGTIRYAIEKLSRRDQTGKPVASDGFTKRMISSLARLGGVAGSMVTGTPAGMIGSSMVNELMAEGPSADPSQIQITDADMLILAKEVETLQNQLLESYFSYRHAKARWKLMREYTLAVGKHTDSANGSTPEALIPLLDTLYEGAKQDEDNTQREYISARNALGLMVGQDALAALDKSWEENRAQATAQ